MATLDDAAFGAATKVDRPPPPLQGRTNKTAVLGPAPTDPSWPVPAADRVNVRESLFAEAFNGLLQQNLRTKRTFRALQRMSAIEGLNGLYADIASLSSWPGLRVSFLRPQPCEG